MSMSSHVIGFTPPSAQWQQHAAVWKACEAAGVDIPKETIAFMGHTPPDPAGVEVDLMATGAAREWGDEYRSGLEVDVSKLPKGVTTIRFFNSW